MSPVVLSFDDGPDPACTPALLDALARLEIRAVFFPIAARAAHHPALLARMRAEGHEVGVHGAFHLDAALTPRDLLEADLDLALAWLGEPRPRLWRPPGGRVSPAVVRLAADRGLRPYGWSVDPQDWRAASTVDAMVADATRAVRDGAVILLHDGVGPGPRNGPDAVRAAATSTVELTERLVAGIRDRGLQLGLPGPSPLAPPRRNASASASASGVPIS